MLHVDLAALEFAYDPEDAEGFRAGSARLARQLGAAQTNVTIWELPPGQAICPYHYEYAEEEWLLVLEGRPSVRTPAGVEEVGPGAVVFFPRGPDGAHQVRNDGEQVARVAMFAPEIWPAATEYPDSGKVGIYTREGDDDLIVERSSAVPYYEREA